MSDLCCDLLCACAFAPKKPTFCGELFSLPENSQALIIQAIIIQAIIIQAIIIRDHYSSDHQSPFYGIFDTVISQVLLEADDLMILFFLRLLFAKALIFIIRFISNKAYGIPPDWKETFSSCRKLAGSGSCRVRRHRSRSTPSCRRRHFRWCSTSRRRARIHRQRHQRQRRRRHQRRPRRPPRRSPHHPRCQTRTGRAIHRRQLTSLTPTTRRPMTPI